MPSRDGSMWLVTCLVAQGGTSHTVRKTASPGLLGGSLEASGGPKTEVTPATDSGAGGESPGDQPDSLDRTCSDMRQCSA